jgi:putative transcriptional regulator
MMGGQNNLKGSDSMIQKETTGMILRKLRGDRTQEEVAAALGITKSSWAMYERDERVPRDEVKIRIAKYFGKSVEELFYTQIEHYMCS